MLQKLKTLLLTVLSLLLIGLCPLQADEEKVKAAIRLKQVIACKEAHLALAYYEKHHGDGWGTERYKHNSSTSKRWFLTAIHFLQTGQVPRNIVDDLVNWGDTLYEDEKDPKRGFAHGQFMTLLESTTEDLTKGFLAASQSENPLSFGRLQKQIDLELGKSPTQR